MPSHNRAVARAPRDDVWATLMDSYSYARWVVGSRRTRAVDAAWPSVGARFHHSVGPPRPSPTVDDTTEILELVEREKLVLDVRFRPFGVGVVELCLADGAAPGTTTIDMREHPVRGPAAAVPAPITDALLHLRNELSLRRLAGLAERRRFSSSERG